MCKRQRKAQWRRMPRRGAKEGSGVARYVDTYLDADGIARAALAAGLEAWSRTAGNDSPGQSGFSSR
jgi:hypothetical protein